MLFGLRSALIAAALVAVAVALVGVSSTPRGVADARMAVPKAAPAPTAAAGRQTPPAGTVGDADTGQEQAPRLMKAVDAILQDAAKNRSEARKLPSDADFMLKPIWTETKEDRERRIRDLLDAVLGVVTDAPVVELQK